jgi:basic membrane protein A
MYVNKAYRKPGMILSQYIGKDPSAFNDPTGGFNISTTFFKQGAAVVYHAAGGSGDGLFKAAQEAKKWAIGVDSDQGLIYSTDKKADTKARGKYILTSMLKRVDNAVFLTAKDFIDNDGKLAGGYRTYDLKIYGVGYAVNDFNKANLSDVQARIESLKEAIITGQIVVPDENTDMAEWVKTLQ